MHQRRTHQIGVRVNGDELRRLELRARLTPGYVPVATYLRRRGLDAELRPDPAPELVEAMGRVADLLIDCRRTMDMKQTRATCDLFREATEALREIVARVG